MPNFASLPEPSLRLPTLKPVENVTLREQVTQSVRTALMNGHFQPGQPVTVKAISVMLGASVMPAREAMTRLIAEGALELRPNRTAIVPIISQAEFDEVTELRCHAEGLAAARAVNRIGKRDLDQLKLLDADMRLAGHSGDVNTYLAKNFDFHFLMYRQGASKFVLAIIEKLWVRVGPLIRWSFNDTGFIDAGRSHHDIVDAIENGRSQMLRAAIEADIQSAAETIRKAQAGQPGWSDS